MAAATPAQGKLLPKSAHGGVVGILFFCSNRYRTIGAFRFVEYHKIVYRAVAMSVPLPPPPPPSRRNITANTLAVLEAMAAHNVRTLIYSSTCATYGEPDKMPSLKELPRSAVQL
ncbi:hypothetical protein ZEAMMB73_Zm00001d004053 [Zea mays]|uniref:NAD-dependent epimerase/dehydratase domain-containing protein n=1 Tax=Zea mays TaxID=4577 RepID=A0A1D6ED83_MAIZE|nr:hypothetical protein ZEAMMB73_Zm00001d004053 [Zea mays]